MRPTDQDVGAVIGAFGWGLDIAAGDSGSHIQSHFES